MKVSAAFTLTISLFVNNKKEATTYVTTDLTDVILTNGNVTCSSVESSQKNSLEKSQQRLLKKRGLNVSVYTPYRFRHNCCTRLLPLKMDLKTVQRTMGDNTSDMILRVYANLDESDVLNGSQAYAEALDETLDLSDN